MSSRWLSSKRQTTGGGISMILDEALPFSSSLRWFPRLKFFHHDARSRFVGSLWFVSFSEGAGPGTGCGSPCLARCVVAPWVPFGMADDASSNAAAVLGRRCRMMSEAQLFRCGRRRW